MLWRIVVIALGLCFASSAAARTVVNGNEVDFGWVPHVAQHTPPNVIVAGDQYYDLSVVGLEDMCTAQPYMCNMEAQRQALGKLERDRAIGWTLTGAGFGIAVLGPLATVMMGCSHDSSQCQPNWAVFTGTLVGGTALGIVGITVTPSDQDVVNFVNLSNNLHPAQPIRLQFSMLGNAPGFVVATGF